MSARALFRALTLGAFLVNAANVTKCARAARLGEEIKAIAPEMHAIRIDLSKLPARLPDGRVLPTTRAQLAVNLIHNLHVRGMLPPSQTRPSIRFLKDAVRHLFSLDNDAGCYAGLAWFERYCDLGQSQFRAACVYLERELGLVINLSRLSDDDRKIAGARHPLTIARTTVRITLDLPWPLANLSDEQILDLIAADSAQLRIPNPDYEALLEDDSEIAETPAPSSSAPTAQLLVDPARFVAACADAERITGRPLPPQWLAQHAASLKLTADQAGVEIDKLPAYLRSEIEKAKAEGRTQRWSRRSLRALAFRFLDLAAHDLANALAAERERTHRAAHKTPEQLEREGGQAATPAPAVGAPAAPSLAELTARIVDAAKPSAQPIPRRARDPTT